jgi:peptide/nickel transport system substrate-binding protein
MYMGKFSFYKAFIFLNIIFIISCGGRGQRGNTENVLKIGTTKDGLKSASILSDSYLAGFAHISNPPLMTMTKEGKIEGIIVKSYEISEDNTLWTFHLDTDFYWSDGVQVSSSDVVFSVKLFAKEVPYARWMREILKNVYGARNNVVIFELYKPYSRLDFDFLTYNLLPQHIWAEIEDPLRYAYKGRNIGCGPFYIQKIDLNAGLILFQKNTFWKGPQPEIERIELHVYGNPDVLALALEKGEVDTYYRYNSSYPYPNLERLRATGDFNFIEEPHLSLKFLGFNLRKKPMSDLAFREAISCAIDYEELIKLDVLGYGEVPNKGLLPRTMPDFMETIPLKYEPEKAKIMMTRAGYIDGNGDGIREDLDGKDLKLSILIRKDFLRLGELVRDYLRALNIDVSLKVVDTNTWTSLKDAYKYDFVISRTSPWGMLMYANWATGYFDSRRTGEGVLHTVDDPAFLKLCDNILSTKDEGELEKFAQKVQDYYAQNLPAIALYWSRIVIPYKKKFSGWSPNPLYGIYNIKNFLQLRIVHD